MILFAVSFSFKEEEFKMAFSCEKTDTNRITMKYFKTEILAFFAWALVMIFEILWARIFWPYIGSSLFVWTSIIAVVLWALAVGYYHGWVISDKWAWNSYLSRLFFAAWITFLCIYVYKDLILSSLSTNIQDIRLLSLMLSLILLAPSSYILGMIPPILIKQELRDIATWGHTVGRLGSIGTIWSIVGTLGAGFFLLPYFWVNSLILFLALTCTLLSIFVVLKHNIILRGIFIVLIVLSWIHEYLKDQQQQKQNIYIYNSPYSRIEINDMHLENGQKIRNLFVDTVTHAGRYLNSDELLYPYTKYYHLFEALNPKAQKVVMLWGAAYSYPQDFLKKYPEKSIDVVEIDKRMTEIAKKHFWLEENPRLRTFHQDGRVFLNRNAELYDAILWDAFGSFFSVPYQLTTLEAVQKKYDSLTDHWVVILNIIWALEWEKARFIEAQYLTYKAVFPEVFLLPVTDPQDTSMVQNIMLVALKDPTQIQELETESLSDDQREYLSRKTYLSGATWRLLTDNFAPVDYYIKALAK